MVPELEQPKITELHIRMNCNGCIQKIKRALNSVEGIYDSYIDYPQQKLTVIGRADPEKIVQAIKKTRKIATICSHTDVSEPPPAEQTTNSEQPAADAIDQPSSVAPAEAAAADDPTKEAPTPEENSVPQGNQSPEGTDATASEQSETNVEEIHMIHHYPYEYRSREHRNNYFTYGPQHEAPYNATHSYSSHRPSASAMEYSYLQSPPQNAWYNGAEAYHDDYYDTSSNADASSITSLFSDENPNACRIL